MSANTKKTKPGRPRSASPRYGAIADDIARRLAARQWQVGRRLPSFREFARNYGVSIHTIHRAFASLKADGRVQIRPHRATVAALGASLESILKHAIGVVSSRHIADSWPALFWNGIAQGAKASDSTLVVLQAEERWRFEFPAGLRDLPLSGVLLLGPLRPELLKQYETLKLPVVLIDQPGDEYNFHSVSVANYEAGFDAASRLIALGHRRLAFMGNIISSLQAIDPDARQRQAGFIAACSQGGLKEKHYKIFLAANKIARQTIQNVFGSTPPFTAVVTTTDNLATQIAKTAEAKGLQIPRDLSIITVRTSQIQTRNWTGPQIDLDEFGRVAVDILRRKPVAPQHIHLKLKWHDGDTFAPPPKRR
jgi:DNA-binding LacI/PurR family transcriptional regulator